MYYMNEAKPTKVYIVIEFGSLTKTGRRVRKDLRRIIGVFLDRKKANDLVYQDYDNRHLETYNEGEEEFY